MLCKHRLRMFTCLQQVDDRVINLSDILRKIQENLFKTSTKWIITITNSETGKLSCKNLHKTTTSNQEGWSKTELKKFRHRFGRFYSFLILFSTLSQIFWANQIPLHNEDTIWRIFWPTYQQNVYFYKNV